MRPEVRAARFLEKLGDAVWEATDEGDEGTLAMAVPALQVALDAYLGEDEGIVGYCTEALDLFQRKYPKRAR